MAIPFNKFVLIQFVLLFLNCILTIDMYNKSHCTDSNKKCTSYLRFPKPEEDVAEQTIKFNFKKSTPYCDPIESKKTGGNMGKLIVSILIMLSSLVLVISSKNTYLALVINILLGITNLIVSAFNFTIYDKCLGSMNCDVNSVSYVDGKGLISSCNKSVDMHGQAFGMYVTMILILIASIIIPTVVIVASHI
jgi:hypothetical protein